MQREIPRQLIHASGILFILLENFLALPYLILLSLTAALIGELIFQIDKKHYIFLFSKILRDCRRDSLERGFIYFFLGLTLTFSLFGFNLAIANAAIIILVLGDALSTIIGTNFGKNKLPFHYDKSWQGTITFLIVAFLGAWTQVPLMAALMGALAGAITEAYSPIDDNLTIPLAAGGVITLVIYFL
jgi:dolichol kinase